MKNDFSINQTIFDSLDEDCENDISEKIIHASEINSNTIKKIAFQKLGLQKNQTSKKNRIKKIKLSLTAAALSIVILGAISVGATGTFDSAFSEYIAGESVNGIFSGGNVKTNSDLAEISFNGITGDEHHATFLMTLKKKDNTAWIEHTENPENLLAETIYGGIPQTSDPQGMTISCSASIAHSLENYLFKKEDYQGLTDLKVIVKDEKTIQIFGTYYNNSMNIKGKTLYIQIPNIYISKIKKVLYTSDAFENDEEWDYFCMNPETYQKLEKDYQNILKENEVIRMDFSPRKIVIAEKNTIPVNCEVAVQLNYKTIEQTLETKKTIAIDQQTYLINHITAGAYSMTLNFQTDKEFSDSDFSDTVFDKLTMTLKDGRKITAHAHNKSSENKSSDKAVVTYQYSYYDFEEYQKNGTNSMIYTLDPSQILSIDVQNVELLR